MHRTFNVSEIQFDDLIINGACQNSFLIFTCISCGPNVSNISSRSVFFDIQIGNLKHVRFSKEPQVQQTAVKPFFLPELLLFDTGFNQLSTSGDVLKLSVIFRNAEYVTSSVSSVLGTAIFPQIQLNYSGDYYFEMCG
jgi:hypothetical protein